MNELPRALPRFPATRPFRTVDRDWYDTLYGALPPYSDQSFGNLLVWGNLNDDLSVGHAGDNVVLRFTDPFADSAEPAAILLGRSIGADAVNQVFDGAPTLHQITVCGKLEGFPGEVSLDRDNSDYLFDVQRHLAMKGSRYARLRSEHRRFVAGQGELRAVELDPTNPAERDRILSTVAGWSRKHPSPNDPSRLEQRALARRLSVCQYVGHHTYQLGLGSRPVAFVICQAVPQPGVVLMCHLKYDSGVPGIFNAAFHRILVELDALGYDVVNLEQDLGKPGLRLHKSLLRPDRLLEKFLVSRHCRDGARPATNSR